MNHLHFEMVGGASGDMILAALGSLAGTRAEEVFSRLHQLLPGEEFKVSLEKIDSHGLGGLRANVELLKDSAHHRTLKDIRKIFESPSENDNVRGMALKVFGRLADAEAGVHGTSPEKIHFHEVGAVDSIVDIAGACMFLDMLGIGSLSFTAFPCGTGTVKCAHGTLPNPAPATMELIKGYEIEPTDEPFELVTPTGAAILTALGTQKQTEGGTLKNFGVSIGQRNLNARPNMLRASLIEMPVSCGNYEYVCVLETNIDDASPELTAGLCQQLMKLGALDVYTVPVFMKKQRAGVLLTVICSENDKEGLQKVIFEESTTFGIRESIAKRKTLEREIISVETPFGSVKVKKGSLDGRVVTFSP